MFQKILISSSIVVLIWLGGFCLFVYAIPSQLEDSHTNTQAIVILTGGRERLKTGFQLLCSGMGKHIFISGVHRSESLKSILKTSEVHGVTHTFDKKWLTSRVDLGYGATNTMENATETMNWIDRNAITSIRLVTAAYHMPRSIMEMRNHLPNITIIPHPVFPNNFDRSTWWWKDITFHLILSEYHKFIGAWVRNKIGSSQNYLLEAKPEN